MICLILSIEFPAAAILKCDVVALQCKTPLAFIAIVFIKSRDWHYSAHTSYFKMAVRRE